MNFSPPRRGRHRKRLSALRLSSDSTVTTLPAYTSPTWSKPAVLPEEGSISDRPPDYPDSAEEADEDTDTDISHSGFFSPPSPLSSRRVRRTQSARTHRRQASIANDPYLDNLLARSVHALEMSNALLQSSISTQSSLSTVLASDPIADRSLEARAQLLSSRIRSYKDVHESWVDDLAEISNRLGELAGESEDMENPLVATPDPDIVSKSLPASDLAERMQRQQQSHLRRPSLDLRNTRASHLQYSNHDRSHFVAPAPRALTMYIDSTDDPGLIVLPPTLGLRTTSHLPPTPLPPQRVPGRGTASGSGSGSMSAPVIEPQQNQTKRIVDVLSSYVSLSPPRPSAPASSSPRLSFMSPRSDRSSSASSHTVRKVRKSRSPVKPVPLLLPTSCSPSSSGFRSRSLTPLRTASTSSSPRASCSMTPPIEELSTSSESSSSDTLHIDRTLESLRSILSKQPQTSPSQSNQALPPPRPSFLSPPIVEPVAGTSNATASISRLFTKGRHSSSTRPPSPPRQPALKNRSAPPTPIDVSAPPTPSLVKTPSLFNFGETLGIPRFANGSMRTTPTSSGRSTPKRISFAELPESYAGSKLDGAPSKFRDKTSARSRKDKSKKGKEKDDGGGWWTGWLLGAAGTGNATGLSLGASREDRLGRSSSWSSRPGLGGGWEEWGA